MNPVNVIKPYGTDWDIVMPTFPTVGFACDWLLIIFTQLLSNRNVRKFCASYELPGFVDVEVRHLADWAEVLPAS